MTLWDLRMYIEQQIPWWAPFAFVAIVLGAGLYLRWCGDKYG